MKDNTYTTIHYLAVGIRGLGLVGRTGVSGDASELAEGEQVSANRDSILTTDYAIDPSGVRNVGTRPGDDVHVAGVRGEVTALLNDDDVIDDDVIDDGVNEGAVEAGGTCCAPVGDDT